MANHALEIREAKFLFTENVVSPEFVLFIFYIKILHGKREERLTRHMRNNEVLQNIYFFTTNFIIISCKHYALSILSIHGRQAPAYCLRVEPNSVFG